MAEPRAMKPIVLFFRATCPTCGPQRRTYKDPWAAAAAAERHDATAMHRRKTGAFIEEKGDYA